MTTDQKLLGWIALGALLVFGFLDQFHVKVHEDFKTLLVIISFGCFFSWLAHLLKSQGKDGWSVMVIPAAFIIIYSFPGVRRAAMQICGYLMWVGLTFGGYVAAKEAAKKSKERPVLTFSVVFLAWYLGLIEVMTAKPLGLE